MQQYNQQSTQIDSGKNDAAVAEQKHESVKIDNLHDLLYASSDKLKKPENLEKKAMVGADGKINVLEQDHFKVIDQPEGCEPIVDLGKVKINKQFKLASSLPKL